MSLSGKRPNFYNRPLSLLPGLKPRVLQGKDGLLGLPANVDFRSGARCAAAADRSEPVHPSPLPVRRRSLLPLAILVAMGWGVVIAAWVAA